MARSKPSSGERRPPFTCPHPRGYVISKFKNMWARREELCRRYLEVLRGADVQLSEGPIIWLNHLERVAASTFPWIQSGFVLDVDLEHFIDSAHLSRVGHDRPVTRSELQADEREWTAAIEWAADTLGDPKWGPRVEVFVEDVDLGNEARVQALAERCWPTQTTLTPTSARWFYRQQVGDIPFEPLATHLEQCDMPKYDGVEAAAFLEQWRFLVFGKPEGHDWQPSDFRSELRRERERFRERGLTQP